MISWNRFYDPDTGRYLSADPIGLDGGMNLYGYVRGNPVNKVDPQGLIYIEDYNDLVGSVPVSGSLGGGLGYGVHPGFAGINRHSHRQYTNGGWVEVTTTCIRLGPGWFAGGGIEAGGGFNFGSTPPDSENCPCTKTWSIGLGGDYAIGPEGASGSIGVGNSGFSLGGNWKLPYSSFGLGLSAGLEFCSTTTCPR